MNAQHLSMISAELTLRPQQVEAVEALLIDGATVPFIARYRKEATGSLDERAITAIRDRLGELAQLDKRRASILASLEERGLLTDALREQVAQAPALAVLEDIYLPFRPKRRTRAMMARERGLEPLAVSIFAQDGADPAALAAGFVNAELGVAGVEDALSGARDIIAEQISEDTGARAQVRDLAIRQGKIRSEVVSGKEESGAKFKDYFDWTESLETAPSHRVLAMLRGENEGALKLSVGPAEPDVIALLERLFVKGDGPAAAQVRLAIADGVARLLGPSMETEMRQRIKERADRDAIRVFGENVRQLLLAPALGQKRVMALDPGFRTGCKVVCLDAQGKLLHHDVIFPHGSTAQVEQAGRTIEALCERFEVQTLAVGNGTGGRETESFLRRLKLRGDPPVVMVSESGASIYSASDVARDEFPDQDLTVRGAVSIGRRLMDPLAELVKIDPRSIGVGQYQHDVDTGSLKAALDDVVSSCVNSVGVEINTASKQLLAYVSGLGPALAARIVAWREANGPFRTRAQLMDVPRLGSKAFEQAAGFLRIRGGDEPLDASAVHPESYPIVQAMARDLACHVADLLSEAALRARIELARYVAGAIGMPTLEDILGELARPGRDPRERFEPMAFAQGIEKLEDLKPGMKLPGVVTNITAFGAFVDVGVHQDGLVHVSQLADRFVKDPSQVVKLQQRVTVTVIAVDLARRRISLSMRSGASAPSDPQAPPRRDAAAVTGRSPASPSRGAPPRPPPPPRPGRSTPASGPRRPSRGRPPGRPGAPAQDAANDRPEPPSALSEQLLEWQKRQRGD